MVNKDRTFPIKNKLFDIRFHNWRFFKGVFGNKCNKCCLECNHLSYCKSSCDRYKKCCLDGYWFNCENCHYKLKK